MNLALLRVCAAVMIMNALYNIAGLLFKKFNEEMTGDVEPLGFYIASVLFCVIIFALGIVTLVKKNAFELLNLKRLRSLACFNFARHSSWSMD